MGDDSFSLVRAKFFFSSMHIQTKCNCCEIRNVWIGFAIGNSKRAGEKSVYNILCVCKNKTQNVIIMRMWPFVFHSRIHIQNSHTVGIEVLSWSMCVRVSTIFISTPIYTALSQTCTTFVPTLTFKHKYMLLNRKRMFDFSRSVCYTISIEWLLNATHLFKLK